MKIKSFIYVTIAIIVLFVISGLFAAQKQDLQKAPDFSLYDVYGNQVSLTEVTGKVVILDFWATWCPPCKMEIPHFNELYTEYKDKGLEIIGIALNSQSAQELLSFMKSYNINYTIVIGNEDVVKKYGGIRGVPTTFIIDRQGNIKEKYVGYREKGVFESAIKELL